MIQRPAKPAGGTPLNSGAVTSSRASKVPSAAFMVISASAKPSQRPGQWKPGLVDGFLGAEKQPVPADAGRRARQVPEPVTLVRQRHQPQHLGREPLGGLGVEPDRDHLAGTGDGGGAVPVAVRNAADDARRPLRRTALARQDRRRRDGKGAEGGARAAPAGGEFSAPFWHRPGDQRLFSGEERGVRRVAECLSARHHLGQDLADHPCSSRSARAHMVAQEPDAPR